MCFVGCIHGVVIHLHVVGNTKAERAILTGRHVFSLRSTESYVFLIYYISTVNTQCMQRPDVLLQLGFIWRHVSAVNRQSSGQQRVVLQCVPLATEPGISLIILPLMRILQRNLKRTYLIV